MADQVDRCSMSVDSSLKSFKGSTEIFQIVNGRDGKLLERFLREDFSLKT
jgi:hypothetical protein